MEAVIDVGLHVDVERLRWAPVRWHHWVDVIIQPARVGRFVRDQAVAGGGAAVHQNAQGARDVGFQFGFGRAGLLKIQDVQELVLEGFAHPFDGRAFRATAKGHGHTAYHFHTGFQQGQIPGNVGPPVVPDHGHLFMPEMIHGALNIAADGRDIVCLDCGGCAAAPIAAHLGGERAVTGVGKRLHLMPPGVPALGKTMQQPHRLAVLGPGNMYAELDIADIQNVLFALLHGEVPFAFFTLCQIPQTKACPLAE